MVEAKVYHCTSSKTRFSAFQITPAGVLIVGSSPPTTTHPPLPDVGQLYANAIGASLPRYELSDARACQLLIVSHLMSFYAIPAPEAFSRCVALIAKRMREARIAKHMREEVHFVQLMLTLCY